MLSRSDSDAADAVAFIQITWNESNEEINKHKFQWFANLWGAISVTRGRVRCIIPTCIHTWGIHTWGFGASRDFLETPECHFKFSQPNQVLVLQQLAGNQKYWKYDALDLINGGWSTLLVSPTAIKRNYFIKEVVSSSVGGEKEISRLLMF